MGSLFEIVYIRYYSSLYFQDKKKCYTCGKVYKTTDRSVIDKHKENCKLWKNCLNKTEAGLFACKFCPRTQKKLHQIWSHLKEIHSDQIGNKSREFVGENCQKRNKSTELPKLKNDDTIDSATFTMDHKMSNSTSKDSAEIRWDKTLIRPTKYISKLKNDEKVESLEDQPNNRKCEFCRDYPNELN